MQVLFSAAALGRLALCFGGWFFIQSGAAWLCFRMPDLWFKPDHFPFRPTRWEAKGRLYAFLRRAPLEALVTGWARQPSKAVIGKRN